VGRLFGLQLMLQVGDWRLSRARRAAHRSSPGSASIAHRTGPSKVGIPGALVGVSDKSSSPPALRHIGNRCERQTPKSSGNAVDLGRSASGGRGPFISRSRWNGGYGADSGPPRGNPCRPALRPLEVPKPAILNVSFTSTPAVRFAQIPAVRRRLGERASSTRC
jgi:hypothetical protein